VAGKQIRKKRKREEGKKKKTMREIAEGSSKAKAASGQKRTRQAQVLPFGRKKTGKRGRETGRSGRRRKYLPMMKVFSRESGGRGEKENGSRDEEGGGGGRRLGNSKGVISREKGGEKTNHCERTPARAGR